jgi:hypothetical protein
MEVLPDAASSSIVNIDGGVAAIDLDKAIFGVAVHKQNPEKTNVKNHSL